MTKDDDRDVRRPKTPPAGVRAQTSPPTGEFEVDELTPVFGDQVTKTQARATQAAGSSRAALAIVREVQATQKQLGEQVKAYAEADKADHTDMKSDIAEIKGDVKTLTAHVGDMREEFGNVSGKLEVLTSTLQLDQQNAAHAERVRISYRYEVKKAFWKTGLKVIGAGAGAVAAGIAGYYVAKWLGIAG